MEFNKNSELFTNVCLVQIKSTDATVDLASLTTIYHTPSKISLSVSSSLTKSGPLHRKSLTLSYPGLSSTDFQKFHDLMRGQYQMFVKMHNNDIYEVASAFYPMDCRTTFNTNRQVIFTVDSPIPITFRENQPEDGITADGFDYDFDFYLQ